MHSNLEIFNTQNNESEHFSVQLNCLEDRLLTATSLTLQQST